MKELKEAFGTLEAPQELASLLFDSSKRSQLGDKLQTAGNTFSLDVIEHEMNALTRSLVSLGASFGDTIAIYGFDYSDALNLYLASGQVGVNVVNLGSANTITELNEGISTSKARFVFFAKDSSSQLGDEFLDHLNFSSKAKYPEYAIVQDAKNNTKGTVLSWEQFQSLERFATNWEIGLLRVV